MASMTVQSAWLALHPIAAESGGIVGASYFKIGEGGWIEIEGVRSPREPDPSLLDLDCIENPDRYGSSERFFFQKTLTADRITQGVNSVSFECIVSSVEALQDSDGLDPEFWEIGVFDANDVMMAYATFSRQPKIGDSAVLRHTLKINFSAN